MLPQPLAHIYSLLTAQLHTHIPNYRNSFCVPVLTEQEKQWGEMALKGLKMKPVPGLYHTQVICPCSSSLLQNHWSSPQGTICNIKLLLILDPETALVTIKHGKWCFQRNWRWLKWKSLKFKSSAVIATEKTTPCYSPAARGNPAHLVTEQYWKHSFPTLLTPTLEIFMCINNIPSVFSSPGWTSPGPSAFPQKRCSKF